MEGDSIQVTFLNAPYLWMFASIPVILIIHYISLEKIKRKAILFANYEAMEQVFGRKILSKNYPLLIIRILALIFLIFAVTGTVIISEGIVGDYDYALAIDASASMLAQDYLPDRITAAKESALQFIGSIADETMVGILSFSGTGFIQQDLTENKDDMIRAIEGIEIQISGGTAIGEAIIDSVNILQGSEKERIIVLLTDGQSNMGIDIETALDYANRFQAAIHTIGIGTDEGGLVRNTSFIAGLDSETLQMISERTGGKYYRAEDEEELEEVYREIATGTKKDISNDISSYLMLIGISLFVVELILVNSKYRTIP